MASHKLVQPNTPTAQSQASQPEASSAETPTQSLTSAPITSGARSRPGMQTPGAILGLQRTLGNQAVIRLRAAEQRRQPFPAGTPHPAGSPYTAIVQRNGEPRGLPNRKFDCFLNAITQVMAGPYAAFFNPATNNLATWYNAVTEKQVQALARAQRVQAAVWAIIQRINNADQTVINKDDIGNLRKTLLQNEMVLSENDQEDAAELMRKLLEPVLPADQSIGMSVGRVIEDKDTTKIDKDKLGSDPAKYTKAPSAKEGTRKHDEATNMIAVDMDRYNSLDAFLYEQFGKGVVTEFDPKNRPKVEYDSQAVEASKVTERRAFTRLPALVTFNLKRFRERFEGGKERVGKPFVMPKALFLVSEAPSAAKSYVEYELAGVVVQTGTLSGGHYYGHIKRGDKWHRADDATVTENQVDEDINQGYIYTYRRVRDHSVLPKGATAAQETEPKPGDISLDAELSSYSGLLDSGATSSATPAQGKSSDRILGMQNRADDCFLNAVLQLMAGPFATLFDPSANKLPDRLANFQGWLWSLMQRINKKTSSKQSGPSITKEEIARLRKHMVKLKLVQGEKGQEDAAEVVRLLLALVTPRKDTATIETERRFDRKDAYHIPLSALPNNPASYNSRRSTGTIDTSVIEVEMGTFNSLEGFLYHHYGVGETIEYDNKNRPKILDTGFSVEVSKIKQRKIFKHLPPLMTFILHRFQINQEGQRVRINRKFAMPEQLLLIEQPPRSRRRYVEFELVGMVVQTGGLESGHYYTHRKDEKRGDWLRANDSSVTESAGIGPDLNEGYIYTYRRKEQSESIPKDTQAAQTNKRFAADDLGIRLVDRIAMGRFAEAQELLTFPNLDVNAQTEEHGTALCQAVKKNQLDLVRRLLMRGADPTIEGPEGTPQDIGAGKSDTNDDIKMALQIYSMSDFGKIIAHIKGMKPGQATKLNTEELLAAYQKLDNIERLLNEQASTITSPLKDPPEKMAGLAQGLEAVQQQRRMLNEWLADFYEIKRAGAGKRPDAGKAITPPVVNKPDQQFLIDFLQQVKDMRNKEAQAQISKGSKTAKLEARSPQQMLASQGKEKREKDAQEALTALFAIRQGLFKKLAPGKDKFDKDIDFQGDDDIDFPKDKTKGAWDQKAIVQYDDLPFDGRLIKTHHKLKKGAVDEADDETAETTDETAETSATVAANQKLDATVRPSEREDEAAYKKVGLLFDSTYIDELNYERAWETILKSVLQGDLDPRYIKETRAPQNVNLISEDFFDVAQKNKQPWALAALAAEKLATHGTPMSTIRSGALPAVVQARLIEIVKQLVNPFKRHSNNRGWLPGNFLYFEYAMPSGSPDQLCADRCRLVVSHDLRHIYLTCSHYKAFSYQDGENIINRTPFYAIVPEGELESTMGKSAPALSPDGSTPTTTKAVSDPSATTSIGGGSTPTKPTVSSPSASGDTP